MYLFDNYYLHTWNFFLDFPKYPKLSYRQQKKN